MQASMSRIMVGYLPVEETAKHTSVGQALPAEETEKDTKMRFGSYADAVRFRKD